MDHTVMSKFDLEAENKAFYQRLAEFQARVAKNNGSSIVKDEDQYSMDLGIELPIDVMIPVSPTELAWREKQKAKHKL